MKSVMKLATALAVTAMFMLLASAAHAATVFFSPSNAPPSLGSIVISNLFDAYISPLHGTDFGQPSNVGAGDGLYTYIADDKAVVGQSFTTGTNAAGYKVVAVTLRAAAYGGTFSWVPSVNYAIRITKPSGMVTTNSTLTVLATETAEVGVDWANCMTCNVPSIGDGASKGAGCGRYITFTLNTPVALLPNTLYGFDVGLNTDNIDNITSRHTFYWETDGRARSPDSSGTNQDLYTNGTAYGSGPWNGTTVGGHGDTTLTNILGDRCFIVSLTPATVVTPPRITTQVTPGGGATTNQPHSGMFYTGVTARFFAKAAGDTNLVYQWRMSGTNISNGTKFAGTLTDTLSVSNVSAGDSGSSFTLVVTNSAGAITTAPPATLTVVAAPVPGTYAYTVYTNHPIAHWRLNEFVNPATNPPTFDNMGGGVGAWETNALQAAGPRPSTFSGFETNNTGTQSRTNAAVLDHSWSTLSPLNLNTNTVTLTAWIYPNGPPGVQGGKFSGFFFTRANSTECGMQVGDANTSAGQLAYTWNDGQIKAWPSGFTIPANQWSFIGLVITPTSGTVYFGTGGGALQSAVNTAWHDVEIWSGPWTVGYDPRFAGNPQYVFNGVVDEVAAWNRSLSFNEMTNLYAAAFTTNTSPPPALVITCSSNKTVQCGSAWSFDTPSATSGCCSTNVTITVTSTITNGTACSLVITRTWQATDCCSNSASCSQIVTVVDTAPPLITCASNKTVQCGSAWSFDAPSASDVCCGTNVTMTVTGTITNGTACSLVITRTWQATDCCSNSASCSQIVTVVSPDCAPVQITAVSYAGTTLTMSFQSLSCVVYDCQHKDDLIGGPAWATFQTVTGTGNIITVQDTLATSGHRFYRVVCRCH